VQGSGFRVQGSGFRVQGSGSEVRVQGSGFRAQGLGVGVQVSGCGVMFLKNARSASAIDQKKRGEHYARPEGRQSQKSIPPGPSSTFGGIPGFPGICP
jgi:hypothetical protein